MSAHTPGLLALEEAASDSGHIKHLCPVDSEGMSLLTVVEHEGVKFAAVYSDDDARRLMAAWNACEGIETYALELMTGDLSIENQLKPAFKPVKVETSLAVERRHEIKALRAVNAELLAALELMKKRIRLDDPLDMYDMVCEAIARATAQAGRALLENKS